VTSSADRPHTLEEFDTERERQYQEGLRMIRFYKGVIVLAFIVGVAGLLYFLTR